MSILGLHSRYLVKYNPLPSGVPSGEELYLTLYPLSHLNIDTAYYSIVQYSSTQDTTVNNKGVLREAIQKKSGLFM